ncbi:M1 family metallopeptidase [Rosistilla oblonga]|uniref:M1 family metallopeptidase n=1 Tax=Rosistilla oblonga TaxID=2527990 RepID=UPI003A975381
MVVFFRRSSLPILTFAILVAHAVCEPVVSQAQPRPNNKYGQTDDFRQIDQWLPTPNKYRSASGMPGPEYWQQRADYKIDVRLDDQNQKITGSETIDYHNHAPEPLGFLWIQLDQNIFEPGSDAIATATAPNLSDRASFNTIRSLLARESFEGGFKIHGVTDAEGGPLKYTIVKTMMRIDLPTPLPPGESTTVKIRFDYLINDSKLIHARTGYEFFEKDGNYIYEIAHWYPRVAAFTDYEGWQNKQFLGRGEFTLELGDFEVRITAPEDHIVAATGVLQNGEEVLTETQRQRLEKAKTAKEPVFVVTPEEALKNQKDRSKQDKTWVYHAENVRDFAWASSRKFIWDAQGHDQNENPVMAMSYYPNEAEPLWSKYSTHAIIHTLDVYSRYTFDYPYPIAISVNGPVYGMEYPMICFNGPRPEEDKTYTARTKYGLISVIIHEVGHNYFPMIVNSDERQWTWMDEGLNTFLQYLAEQEWEDDYPSKRGEPEDITGYMRSSGQVPIMTNSESILQFGSNAYGKPATALNILRETILGRELFDFAFREYARRWKFKRPTPADFFRTMEDASGVDLDWFWNGWFYSTDHVDLAIRDVKLYQIDSSDPDEEAERKRQEKDKRRPSLSAERNEPLQKRIDLFPGLKDFYNDFDELEVTEDSRKAFQKFVESLNAEEKQLIRRKTNFYVLTFENVGGLVMPIIAEIRYTDGSKQMLEIPAEIWRTNNKTVSKLVITDKELDRIEIDPRRQLADTDASNNFYPPRIVPSRFKLYKNKKSSNPMRKANEANKKSDAEKGKESSKDEAAEKKPAAKAEAAKPAAAAVAKPATAEAAE